MKKKEILMFKKSSKDEQVNKTESKKSKHESTTDAAPNEKKGRLKFVWASLALLLICVAVIVPLVVLLPNNSPKEPPAEKRTISFEAGDVLNVDEIVDTEYAKGTVINEWEIIPLQADKMFLDWYSDSTLETVVEFPLTVEEDMTLYAKYLDGNLPESFYQYDEASDSYFVVKGTEKLAETTVIPDMHNGSNGIKAVTKIVDGQQGKTATCVFGKNTTIKNVYLGNKITYIGMGAFVKAEKLEFAFIGRNVSSLGTDVFNSCTNLRSVWLSKKLKELPEYSFYKDASLVSIDNCNVVNIGDICFSKCSNLSSIDLTNVKYIGNSALAETKVQPVLPEGLIWIGDHAFSHNGEAVIVESITIPATLVQLGGSEFVGDNEENNILSSHVFYNCGVATIKEYKVAEGNEHFDVVDGVLYTKNHKYLLAYPPAKRDVRYEVLEGCEDFGEMSFSRAHFLKTLVLPNSYTIHTNLPENFNFYKLHDNGKDKYTNLVASVYCYTSVESFEVKDDNTKYKSVDGVIYSFDGKEPLAFPSAKGFGKVVTFADSVETINVNLFFWINTIFTYNDQKVGGIPQKIVIGESVKTISDIFLEVMNDNGYTFESLSPFFEVNQSGKLVRKNA